MEFIDFIKAYGLLDIGLTVQKFTWSSKRGISQRIWKRLEGLLVMIIGWK